MRKTIPQRQLGDTDIAKIALDYKSRDDNPAILLGLQHLYSDQSLRARLFVLLEEELVPNANHKLGRPGMDLWQILVMGVVMQGLDCDFDRLHDLVNHHSVIRQFLGHSDIWDKTTYSYQSVVDNVSLLRPELLAAVGKLVVDSGHKVAKKSLAKRYAGGVILLLSKQMFIIRRMSICYGMRCVVFCARLAVKPASLILVGGGNGRI